VGEPSGRLGRNFWKLTLSASVWSFSDGLRWPVVLWLATTLTASSGLIAAMSVAAQLPQLIFLVPAGVIIDRFDRRRIMMFTNVCDLAMVGVLGLFVWSDSLTITTLLVLTFLCACSDVFTNTTAQVLLKNVADDDQIERANGVFHAAMLTSKDFLGSLSGGVLAAVALGAALFISASGFALAVLCVWTMRGRFRARQEERAADRQQVSSFRQDAAVGLRWVWKHQVLRDTGIVVGISNLAWGAILATLVLFARDVLDIGATWFGLMLATLAGGGVVGSFLAEPVERKIGAAAYFVLGLVLLAAAFLVMALTSQPIVAFVMIACIGSLLAIWDVIWTNLAYNVVPEELLGRVRSILRISEYGMMPVGALIGGVMIAIAEDAAPRYALQMPWLFGAGVFVLLALYMAPRVTRAQIDAARMELEARLATQGPTAAT
jgi:Na+/melibiose symporter-like transporter